MFRAFCNLGSLWKRLKANMCPCWNEWYYFGDCQLQNSTSESRGVEISDKSFNPNFWKHFNRAIHYTIRKQNNTKMLTNPEKIDATSIDIVPSDINPLIMNCYILSSSLSVFPELKVFLVGDWFGLSLSLLWNALLWAQHAQRGQNNKWHSSSA